MAITVVAGIIQDSEGLLLCAKRGDWKDAAGKWEFPGGKVEKDELPNQCLVREVGEELGVNITNSCFSPITFTTYDYPDFSVLLFLYICREWEGFIQAREGQVLKWHRPNDLSTINMLPADIPLISYLRDTVS